MSTSSRAFRLTSERNLSPCRPEDALHRTEGQPPCWMDICSSNPRELSERIRPLQLHPLALDACLDDSPASRVVAFGESLVIVIPTHATWDAQERLYLIVICLPGLLVTVHREVIPALEWVAEQYSDGMRFHGDSTSAILYQVVDHIIDESVSFTLRTRDAVDRLDDLQEQEDDDVIKQLLPLKRQLTRLAAAVEDQLYCVGALQTVESKAFRIEGLREYFRDAFMHLEHASRSLSRQQMHVAAIQQSYQLRLQDRTNDRLRLLTIISTIFIPLTLIAGIYGMNFRYMPELHWRYGYFGTLLAMAAIAVAMLWGFYRSGWFR